MNFHTKCVSSPFFLRLPKVNRISCSYTCIKIVLVHLLTKFVCPYKEEVNKILDFSLKTKLKLSEGKSKSLVLKIYCNEFNDFDKYAILYLEIPVMHICLKRHMEYS